MTSFEPDYITFDCYGTLTNFQMSTVVREIIPDRVGPADVDRFIDAFRTYRADEVIGAFKPYPEVLRDSWQRACNRWRVQYRPDDVDRIIEALGSWGPHPEVPAALRRLAERYPLVIFSNAVDGILAGNVEKLGADFHRVFTAEQARAYKPRLRAFEYMFDQLDTTPDRILHVSSHVWYDMLPARWLGVEDLVYVDRGYDLEYGEQLSYTAVHELSDFADLPELVGA